MSDLMRCPNCEALMNVGDACPECPHDERWVNFADCECQHCQEAAEQMSQQAEFDHYMDELRGRG